MITKFQTSLGKIEKVQCERENGTMVWVNGRGRKKLTSYESFFDSWKEAKAHIIQQAQEEVNRHQRNLDAANKALSDARALREKE